VLYTGRAAESALRSLADEEGVDLVVTDMVRTAVYGSRLGRPWIADLDDLLSRRYRLMAAEGGAGAAGNLLGYHRAPLLRAATRLLAPFLPLVLTREADAIASREVEVARQAQVASLVSAAEAEQLAALAGRPVAWTPMAIPGPEAPPAADPRPRELCFLGGLDYGPNDRSLRAYDREIRPRLVAAGLGDLVLEAIGTAPSALAARFSQGVAFRGYVEDLPGTLAEYRAMLVPPVMPGGVKTKIIDGALNGVVVLAHVSALEGMALAPGRDVLAWESAEDLARLLLALRAGTIDRAAVATTAHAWARETFGEARLRALWAGHVAACPAPAAGAPPGPGRATAGRTGGP
jgi:hypothetical protein